MAVEKREIRAFTGLRGVAAFYVMIYHFHFYDFAKGHLHDFLFHGYLAVEFFFILSGFVMALTYRELFVKGFTRLAYTKFLGRRFARIYPLYLFMTLVALVVYKEMQPEFLQKLTPTAVVSNIFLVQAWGIAKGFVEPGWSISTEFAAYLLFPALASIFLFSRQRTAYLGAAATFIALIIFVALPDNVTGVIRYRGPLDMSDGENYGPLVRCILEFALGVFAFRLAEKPSIVAFLSANWVSVAVSVLIAILLFIAGSDLLIICPIALLVLSTYRDTNLVARLLGTSPIYGLGVISYSLYLVHTVAQEALLPTITAHITVHSHHAMVCKIVLSVIVLGLSTASYFVIEKPGRTFLRKAIEPKMPVPPINTNLSAP